MKIRIKTSLIDLKFEDNPTIGSDNYTKRTLPEFTVSIKSSIDEAIRLHNEVVKSLPA